MAKTLNLDLSNNGDPDEAERKAARVSLASNSRVKFYLLRNSPADYRVMTPQKARKVLTLGKIRRRCFDLKQAKKSMRKMAKSYLRDVDNWDNELRKLRSFSRRVLGVRV